MLTACVWAGTHARARGAGAAITGKKTPGGAGTHTGHTGHTGARGHTDHTDEPHNHPLKSNDTPAHENRDRLNSRKNNRKPGVDRSLPVQHSTVPVPGCSVPVKRHWGEPGHTRETRDTRVQRHRGSRDTQETDTEHHKPTSKTGTVATSTFCIHVVPRAPFPIGGDPYPGLSVSPLIWFHDGYRPCVGHLHVEFTRQCSCSGWSVPCVSI